MKYTHLLSCRQCNNGQGNQPCYEYSMPCRIIKNMGDGRVKIAVYGNRYWKKKADPKSYKERIRYVDDFRVTKIL